MFTKQTVFVLGAGASWHYGYPTGEELVKKILQKMPNVIEYFSYLATRQPRALPNVLGVKEPDTASADEIAKTMHAALEQCLTLKAGLEQVNPLVIDYYLGWNPALQTIGKLLIAWVILECEYTRRQNGANINRRELLINSPYEDDRKRANGLDLKRYKDDWCRFVIHQLAINRKTSDDLLGNKIRFVTFNYDISLECALYDGLRHIERFSLDDIDRFLSGDRIMHVYGRIRGDVTEQAPALNWSEQSRDLKGMGGPALEQSLSDYKTFFDCIYDASQGIHVIEDDKKMNEDEIKKAIEEIDRAEYVYILGYGFDTKNSELLQLARLLRYDQTKGRFVYFTNFQSINRVTKRASEIFFGRPNAFPQGVLVGPSGNSNHYERSLRDVYEALELDFDWFD